MSATPPSPMPLGRYRLLLAVLVIGAGAALFAGIRATDTGEEGAAARSEIVERYIPQPTDEVLRQAELGIDLAPGYEATIAVNGVEIPAEDQRRVPEQNQVFFTPGDGKAVERLHAGQNCATATAWRSADGRGTANDQTFTWCFNAT